MWSMRCRYKRVARLTTLSKSLRSFKTQLSLTYVTKLVSSGISKIQMVLSTKTFDWSFQTTMILWLWMVHQSILHIPLPSTLRFIELRSKSSTWSSLTRSGERYYMKRRTTCSWSMLQKLRSLKVLRRSHGDRWLRRSVIKTLVNSTTSTMRWGSKR